MTRWDSLCAALGIERRPDDDAGSRPADPPSDPEAPHAMVEFDLDGVDPRAWVGHCLRCAGAEGSERPVVGRSGYVEWVDCGCVAQRRRAALWNASGIPRLLAPCALSRAAPPRRQFLPEAGTREALSSCEAIVVDIAAGRPAPGVLLTGKPGLGKSHLLAAVVSACTLPQVAPALMRLRAAHAARVARRGADATLPWAGVARYVSCVALQHEASAALDASDGAMTRLREAMTSVPVLALDELGDIKAGSWLAGQVGGVLHQRHELGLTTLVGTNYSPTGTGAESLAARVPPHILSRLLALPAVAMTGRDWRTRGPV
jgi:DNA replication protein DnaC